MNFIDRVVGYVSPSAGFKRVRAREAMDQVRAYAAARDFRGRNDWKALGTGANAEIGSSMVKTRNRVRQLVRDNGLAKRIVDLWALHLIGDGITVDFTGVRWRHKATKFDIWAGLLRECCILTGGKSTETCHSRRTRGCVESPIHWSKLDRSFMSSGVRVQMK